LTNGLKQKADYAHEHEHEKRRVLIAPFFVLVLVRVIGLLL